MKKSSSKNKKPIKGNQKISSYFTRLVNGNVNKNGSTTKAEVCKSLTAQRSHSQSSTNSNKSLEVVCVEDSDEDFIQTTPRSKNIKVVSLVEVKENLPHSADNKLSLIKESKACEKSPTDRKLLDPTKERKAIEDVLETITNVPKCSKTPDSPQLTPNRKKRKHARENTPCPDFIPKKLDPTKKSEAVENVLEAITNLPKCSKTPDSPQVTPECKKRKHTRENTPSPDFIPCSLNPKEHIKIKSVLSCKTKFPPKKKAARENNRVHVENLSDLPTEEFMILQSPSKSNHDVKSLLIFSPPRLRCKPSEELFKDLHPTPTKNGVTSVNNKTPEKLLKEGFKQKQKSSEKASQKTPGKTKKISPVKLFSKSPKSLHKFNVEVIENFVTVTPSKSNEKSASTSYASPNVSTRSLEIQQQNESTPTKSPQREHIAFEHSKVKTKLDFSSDKLLAEDETSGNIDETKNQDLDCLQQDIIDLCNENKSDSNINCLLNDSWDGDLTEMDGAQHTLDLTESQHCKIVEIQRSFKNVTLTLKSTKDNTTVSCTVEGFWVNAKLSVNDTLHVSAVYDKTKSIWCVSNDCGLIVFEPDFLVSTTSVVGALFCRRRSVLSERYRGFEPSNRIMIVGILVHKLLQEVLRNNVTIFSEIEVTVKKLLIEKDTVWMCFQSSLSIDDIQKELLEFVPRIVSFMKQYVRRGSGNLVNKVNNKEDWNGKIDKIQDIEENIWCPELGIKGKVDVSIQSGTTIMPLELKTGRATVSLEHRGQVILYVMMMNKFGYTVPSGLLLYLREGVLREIPMTKREKRDLIILRNELTYYLTRKPRIGSVEDNVKEDRLNGNTLKSYNSSGKRSSQEPLVHSELPQPINHHNACSKCPYNTICCTYLTFEDTNLTNNPLMNLKEEILAHLEPVHLKYFVEWSSLLALEASCSVGNKQLHEIYTIPPEKREQNGHCIIRVKIKTTVTECGSLFKHTFEKISKDDVLVNLHSSGIGVGNYVVVSTDARPAVAAGFVTHMDNQTVTISLDRDLNKRYSNGIFHLDTYNSSISQTFNMTSLALLLEASEQAEKLRKIVIDKKPPTFNDKLPKVVATKGTPILRTLNKMQQKAVLKALSSNDYLLIKGMPGTGKTATIVSLVQLLVELNKTVLITSHTHSAVDNVCIRLQDRGINVLRLGAESKINPKLRSCSEEAFTKHCITPEHLEEVYNQASVLAVTCLGSGHPVLSKRQLDVCIVDESTQVLQCSVFRPLYAASKFILIGDPDQLPPVVRNRQAIVRGLAESLFERLDSPTATVTLSFNYRMNKPITAMANALTYQGQLLIANDDVGNATLHLPLKEAFLISCKDNPWVIQVLDETLESSIQILDTGPVWNRLPHLPPRETDGNTPSDEIVKCMNPYETAIVVTIVDGLLKAGVPNNTIGIIAPYRAQVSHISLALKTKNVEVSTVDQFQGRDKEVVIYSCTKSTNTSKPRSETEFEILEDKRRLTVAITRAKHKFILIGDLATVRQYSPFAKLLTCLEDRYFMKLEDGQLGFSWDKIMISHENST